MIDTDRLLAETFLSGAEWHDEVDSTNSLALRMASDLSLLVPLLIGTTRQSAGRGRGTNRWWSDEGTLTFSVLFDMVARGLEQRQWPLFSLVTGLTVAETLETFLPDAAVGLKWPNDVWLTGRKVCGILIEQPEMAPGRLVAGLGWNVNTSFSSAPDDLRSIATSMRETTGNPLPAEDVLVCFLQRWESNLNQLAAGKPEWLARWERFCVLRDRRVIVTTGESPWTGSCLGISEDGALLVSEGGMTRRCYAGTVRLAD